MKEGALKFSVTQKNIKVDSAVSAFLDEKLGKLDNKFKVKITRADVVLKQKKYLFYAEVKLQAKNLRIYGEGESDRSIFAAIERSVGKVEAQLQKHKEKVRKRSGKQSLARKEELYTSREGGESVDESDPGSNVSSGVQTEIESRVLKPMAIEEAVLQMDMVSDKLFDVFIDPRTNGVCVIYRKGKSRYGVITQQK
jgi:putative sigma-54 modulation protein